MNKTSKLWFVTLILLTLILIGLLIVIHQSEINENYTFEAIVLEVYENAALIEPINSTFLTYDTIYAENIYGVFEGERLDVTIKKEVREVYPPVVEVINYDVYRE